MKDTHARQIALISLQYLGEELVGLQETGAASIPEEISNTILTAVVAGMKDENTATKLEGTKAFYHAVVLAQKPFRIEAERNVIMEVCLATCQAPGGVPSPANS